LQGLKPFGFRVIHQNLCRETKDFVTPLFRNLSVLDSFTEVLDGNYSVKNAIFPIQTINIPEQLTKEVTEIFNGGLKQKMKWASSSYQKLMR